MVIIGGRTEAAPTRDTAPASTRAYAAALAAGLVLLAAAAAASLAIGTRQIPPGQVWHALAAPTGTETDGIVRDLRLPRTLIGVAAGAALGLAGAVMQTLTRNPLADPGLLGVNAGASAAVATAIGVLGVTGFTGYLWFAFAGAGLAAVLVTLLGGAEPVRLALAGTAVNAALFGYVNGLQLLDTGTLDAMRRWSVGALDGRRGGELAGALPFLAAGAVLALALARSLDAIALGDDAARSLGAHPGRTRALSVAAITLLTGGATAVCGPIAFVGLMVPHAVRPFTGAGARRLLPCCLVYAPVLLLASDIAGRVVTPPGEVEAGIVTAFLGGLLLVVLVRGKVVRP
ncbi:FecCD family ABC transporter permease [Actinomadura montaniterrae]|uniref:Iron chelate uptake ABC transporter family permease subunit n=1 Tax=Actinomadura montaniterrae TaxID=1803903 RepID=A0A6L3VEZ7_9ACTN|nr:iron chelate uptake ABC transporter family permease subunit [Actinomadura montaniterrae]KAB2364119.1 iron chelate uptake ABC transporter family permease subunit [Actinomadura montaniterrae]